MAEDVRDVGGILSEERLVRGTSGGGGGGYDAFGRESNPYGSYEEQRHLRPHPHAQRQRQRGSGSHSHSHSHSHSRGTPSHSHASSSDAGGGSSSLPPPPPPPADRHLPVLNGGGGGPGHDGDDGMSYGASSRGWGPGAAGAGGAGDGDTYAGGGTYASASRWRGTGGGGDGRRGSGRGGGENPQDNPQAPLAAAASSSSQPDRHHHHRGGHPQYQSGPAPAPAASSAASNSHGESYALSGPGGTRGKSSRAFREEHVRQLVAQGFSTGLARALALNAAVFDHRIWVVDNSGSMQIGDGHRIVEAGGEGGASIRAVPSTRWEEIQDTVRYHAEMAALLDSPTIFKLLNDPGMAAGPQQFSVAHRGEAHVSGDIHVATETMRRAKPGGVTPLTRHIWEIQQSVEEMAPQLQREGKKIVVVLATDGLPTDEQGYGGEYITNEFIRSLRSLEGLPVWLVVRLCTDEEPVTRFYNNLDGQLELSLEVLDDFIGEAHEVYRHNKWLNYALPMHRCRELGYHDRLFDLVDERPLTKGEIRDFCALLFGVDSVDGLPDPGADWSGFLKSVQTLLKREQLQWNPIRKKMTPWINLKALNKIYGKGKGCVIM